METGNQKRVSKDRIKEFKESEVLRYEDIFDKQWDYKDYHEALQETLFRLGTKPRTEKVDVLLDFDQVRNKL